MDDNRRGAILCTRCRKKVQSLTCPCGSETVYIRFYWKGEKKGQKGQRYNRRRDQDGKPLTLVTAFNLLTKINEAMDIKGFQPAFWLDGAVSERRFENVIEKYYEDKAKIVTGTGGISLSKDHLRIIRGYNNTHFKYFHGKDVQDIVEDPDVIHNFIFEHMTCKLKTRRNIVSALHDFFNWLIRKRYIKTMPFFPEINGNDSVRRIALSREAQNEILDKFPPEYRDPIEFMFHTGLRVSEVCALQCGAVDLQNRVVWIERGRKGDTTKNDDKLLIPLNDTCYKIAQRVKGNRFGKEPLFINPITGGEYKYKALRNRWLKYSGMAVGTVGMHSAGRHSFCTQVVPLTDPLTAQRLMRHADIRSTNNYYHAETSRLMEVLQQNDNVIPLKKTEEDQE